MLQSDISLWFPNTLYCAPSKYIVNFINLPSKHALLCLCLLLVFALAPLVYVIIWFRM